MIFYIAYFCLLVIPMFFEGCMLLLSLIFLYLMLFRLLLISVHFCGVLFSVFAGFLSVTDFASVADFTVFFRADVANFDDITTFA